jgi:type II secretory pathway pseudopilin PulG
MLKKKGKRGTTLIALLVVAVALALVASFVGFGFVPDASWAEGV